MKSALPTMALSIAFVGIFIGAQKLDDLDYLRGVKANQAAIERSIQRQQDEADRIRFLRDACGENAGWSELKNGEFQCFTKHMNKTTRVRM